MIHRSTTQFRSPALAKLHPGYWVATLVFCFMVVASIANGQSKIRINQMGYLPEARKIAVFLSAQQVDVQDFQLCEALTRKVVFNGKTVLSDGKKWGMISSARLDFSAFDTPGGYYLRVNDITSPVFRLDYQTYQGTADYLLNYMRQQRCGYNPFLEDSCHTHDGFIVDHPSRTGELIDVTGGWHDATDYLQYLATSANAIYQMLFAYSRNPGAFADDYDARGIKGPNGIPDILDEARWGLEWLLKMNPERGVMFNQIADDRDHRGFRLPNKDTVSYGNGLYRPVYFITGKPQGLGKFKNRTTGVSSTAGKFSTSFAMGATVFEEIDPSFSEKMAAKAREAYEFALTDLGVSQTACMVSPYFYEEDNYVDDIELAAFELYRLTNDRSFLKQAVYWGSLEPVTPWIGKDSARHYQYYPFVNLGHANLAVAAEPTSKEFASYMRKGLQSLYEKGKDDPFFMGIPFIWCSNNLVAAALTQARLYEEATGDTTFAEMEAALRDWLFGCNPWGTSMICGLPVGGDNPQVPHSSITKLMHETTYGGLVDGPVYRNIFNGLRGITLSGEDPFAPFQQGLAVYHDDIGDYSTNEPTMDGTASLSYYLSSLEMEGIEQRTKNTSSAAAKNATCQNVLIPARGSINANGAGNKAEIEMIDLHGAIIRKDPGKKDVYLLLSADEFGEGAEYVLNVLAKKKIKASFFLTGNFLRNAGFKKVVKRMIEEKHYVGPHSDEHLLYAAWENRDSLLLDREAFESDLRRNYKELEKAGVKPSEARYFLPPYEWYNSTIAAWSANMGLKLINFTPGTGTPADYTTPSMANYKTSSQLMEGLMHFEKTTDNRLNGALILLHLGTHHDRIDKFYRQLPELIDALKERGYSFGKL